MVQLNPFLIEGYLSPEFFCDREEETALLTRHLTNGCNVALMAPRRLGKSGLILNCFQQPSIRENYHTIYTDIYETKTLGEFVLCLGKAILSTLRPKGRKAWEEFLSVLQSLKSTVSFDINGRPEWSIGIGDIKHPDTTLDEIFDYLSRASRPCLVAIDEFQAIANYPEKTVEAALRTRIQNCHNAHFVFSGSKRHMMAQMFTSQSRPFYNSSTIMGLGPIRPDAYLDFANRHLATAGKHISREAFDSLYATYEGTTWYIQYILNMLFTRPADTTLTKDDVQAVIKEILSQHHFAYQALLYQLTSKQKQVLRAIAEEGKATGVTSQAFLQRHQLGASTVQGALKTLTERDFVTFDEGTYFLSDRFFAQWILRA